MGAGPCTHDAGASQALAVGGRRKDHRGSLGQIIRADRDQNWLMWVLLLSFPSTLQLTFGLVWFLVLPPKE